MLLTHKQDIKTQVAEVAKNKAQVSEKTFHSTIFHELLNVENPERHPDQLWQEGFLLVGAGTETTSSREYYPLRSIKD